MIDIVDRGFAVIMRCVISKDRTILNESNAPKGRDSQAKFIDKSALTESAIHLLSILVVCASWLVELIEQSNR